MSSLAKAEEEIEDLLSQTDCDLSKREVFYKLDAIVKGLSISDKIAAWDKVVNSLSGREVPTGHPHFHLGVLHLINDPDTAAGFRHLEQAHEQDLKFAPDERAFRMAAYRVLCLIKDFLDDLTRQKGWKAQQLQPPYRSTLIHTLLAVYDHSVQNILDLNTHTYSPFFKLLKTDSLRRFAGENYYFAQDLLERISFESGRSLLLAHEYPIARCIVGLYGGVLEALLLDRLPNAVGKPLGQLIELGYEAGVLRLGTRLTALATMMLYFRNHVHPGRDMLRTDYFVDINVAKGIKVAMDWVISDLSAGP
jgi:hypothetical protein